MHSSSLVAAATLLGLALAAPKAGLPKRASKLQWVGVNEACAEFTPDKRPGTYNGFNIIRVPTLMERMTPSGLSGALDSAYLGHLTDTVNTITSAGAYAIIDAHNYGRFNDAIITSTSDFQSWWSKVAGQFKGNSKIIFDTNNEYHDMDGSLVASLNQAAINGIRGAGATSQYIFVEGNQYTGAWTWTNGTGTDCKTNAETMGSLMDPSNKIIYEMHQYLDQYASGREPPSCVSSTIGSERLVSATNWLRTNGKKGIIGEFAGGLDNTCEAAVSDMLSYMQSNTDVWMGAIWWAAGPWWGDRWYSVEPSNGPSSSHYVPVLKAALGGTVEPPPPVTSTTTTTPPPITTTTTSDPSASPTQTQYGQCAGIGWAGPTQCPAGESCQYQNDYYSQCL
ncbi:carbohydrate-binding module family 1 protein [Zasmidium cellare ATCC 36951]|uniref:cellulase n=1 Tax=Zasmidium cellare ATCC 36951 TaxID=1080233 RepID=A0A6A6BYI5_ZASCE|nr:carbohydrate-binding module family 1 protein [Zasmidium cellare ATCC 36951]KAF2159851.1 carbohydrate-binding module family 1 protein [Zasmidium cellare ATCC 36951]